MKPPASRTSPPHAGHVAALLAAAGHMDELLEAFKAGLTELARIERAARTEATAARACPSPVVVGAKGIAAMAGAKASRIVDDDRFGDPRSLTYWISTGWADLLADDCEGDA